MALGGEIDIQTLSGNVKYKITEGTQTDTVVTLKNQGIKNIHGRGQGDHLVTLIVDVPNNLNSRFVNSKLF